MLNQYSNENDVCSCPEQFIFLHKVLVQNRLFLKVKGIQVLFSTNLSGREAADQKDDQVHGYSKLRDKTHDRLPVTNATSALGLGTTTVILDMV